MTPLSEKKANQKMIKNVVETEKGGFGKVFSSEATLNKAKR